MLESIQSPDRLKELTVRQLKELAEEIREQIIDTLAHTGGHLGANLGVVELTLALHSVWNSPEDKIVWDVGHQCYVHKMLTGRSERFSTLRQYGGLSGFPKRSESPHDTFDVGHSSTSISAAAGMAIARDLLGQSHRVAAVIGDGALTGGMALEALNHVGHLKTDLVVILNDNEMSIGRNVGAMSEYLTRLRLDPTLTKARDELEALVRRIPAIGGSMSRMASSVKDALKSMLPGQLFAELGFSYFGPFDGHNIAQLRTAISDGAARGGPVLLHVITQKGRGYAPAEDNPAKFHGVSAWANGSETDHEKSFSEVFGEALCEVAAENPTVTAVTAAMRDGTGLTEFARRFPKRIFDVGIAEQHSLTLAAGMASQGLRPAVALYSTFLQRGYDQVVHDIGLGRLPVLIGVDRAGVVGDDGPTHHGVFDIGFLRPIPGLTIMAPRSAGELRAMVRWAFAQDGPTVIRYPRGSARDYAAEGNIDVTCSQVLRSGKDCTILAVGPLVDAALAAAEELEGHVSVGVINVRSIKPLDKEAILRAARTTGTIITVEDHVLAGGFGSSVCELLLPEPNVRVHMVGYPDEFVPQGSISELHQLYGLDAAGLTCKIRQLFGQVPLAEAE